MLEWIIKISVVLFVLLTTVAYLSFIERKVAGWIQLRVGPNRVGPWGLLQPAADGLKDLVVTAPLANEDIIKTQPISLTDPELDGATALLGASAPEKGTGKSPRDLLVEKGEVPPAPPGRVDDFRLAKPETAISKPLMRN